MGPTRDDRGRRREPTRRGLFRSRDPGELQDCDPRSRLLPSVRSAVPGVPGTRPGHPQGVLLPTSVNGARASIRRSVEQGGRSPGYSGLRPPISRLPAPPRGHGHLVARRVVRCRRLQQVHRQLRHRARHAAFTLRGFRRVRERTRCRHPRVGRCGARSVAGITVEPALDAHHAGSKRRGRVPQADRTAVRGFRDAGAGALGPLRCAKEHGGGTRLRGRHGTSRSYPQVLRTDDARPRGLLHHGGDPGVELGAAQPGRLVRSSAAQPAIRARHRNRHLRRPRCPGRVHLGRDGARRHNRSRQLLYRVAGVSPAFPLSACAERGTGGEASRRRRSAAELAAGPHPRVLHTRAVSRQAARAGRR
jgi:hypothetical protein